MESFETGYEEGANIRYGRAEPSCLHQAYAPVTDLTSGQRQNRITERLVLDGTHNARHRDRENLKSGLDNLAKTGATQKKV